MRRLRVARCGAVVLMVCAVLWMAACGGGSKPAVTISVSPTTATLNGGGTQQFTATVANSTNTSVTWSASCSAGGAACGAISATGLYTAPAVVASSTSVTVTATSAADTTKTATATVTLTPISVTVAPATASLNGGATQQFTATVAATSNSAVTWTVTCTAGGAACGTISTTGLYTAPAIVAASATVTVKATSAADTTKSGTATVTLNPITVSVGPATKTLTATLTQQFTATVGATANTAVTWTATCTAGGAACGTITTAGLYTAPLVVQTATTVTITATSVADGTKTGTATVTLNPLTITVAPTTKTLTATLTQTFTATITGNPNTAVTWTATCTAGGAACGAIDASGNYTAPTVVVNTTTVTITATSVADTTKTATATVTLNPLSVAVSPGTASLTATATQQFGATITGNPDQSVTWSVSCTAGGAACGTISNTGLYTAPTVATSTYDVTVTATSVADGTKSGTAVVTLNPLTISVSPGTVTLGATQTQTFSANIQGNPNTAVTWTVTCTAGGAACGTIDINGNYTAPATVTSSSTVTVTATSVADGTKSATATVTLTPVVVTISPTTASVSVSGTQQFSANVVGTSNTAVTWSVTCGVASCGTVSNSGLYTAPASVASSPLSVTVTATSNADNTKSASATVTVTSTPVISVAISPNTSQTVTLNGTVFMTASVTNDSGSAGVTWSLSPSSGCGALSGQTTTSATFTAPSSLSSNCTATVTAKSVTDNTKQATLTINVLQTTSLTIGTTQSDMNNAGVGLPYGMYFNISGGTQPYHLSISGGSLPTGLAFSGTNIQQVVGTPTTVGTYNFTLQVTDSASTPATISQSYYIVVSAAPNGAHNSYLTGQYACLLNGYVDADGSRWAMLTSVTADGSGHLSSGVFNSNSKAGVGTGTLVGTYSVGSDNRGVMTVTATPGGTFTYTLAANSVAAGPSTTIHLVEFDDAGTSPSGQHGDGTCYKQDTNAFVSGTLSGGFAFGMTGESGSGTPRATVGRLSMSGGTISNGVIDQAKGGTYQHATFTGTYLAPDSNGRFTMALVTPGGTANFVSYIIDANRSIMMSADSHASNELESGDVRKQQQGTYAAANINGSFVMYEQSIGISTSDVIQGYRSQVMQGSCNSSGSCNVNISDADEGGTYRSNDSVGAATATVESSGRVTVLPGGGNNIYFYLYDQNSGFMLDPGSTANPNVGFGWMEHQTQTSFTLNSFAGTYILDPLPEMQSNNGESSGYVSIDTSGVVTGANDSGGQSYTDYNQQIGASLSVTNATYGQATVSMSGHAGLYCYAITSTKVACIEGSSNHPDVQRLEQ